MICDQGFDNTMEFSAHAITLQQSKHLGAKLLARKSKQVAAG